MINTNTTNALGISFDDSLPALYVGTYGKYATGSTDGAWVNPGNFDSAEEFLEYCAELHSDEDNPEFMFQDSMNLPKNMYSESASGEDLENIIEYCNLSDTDREIVEAYYNCMYGDATIREILDDCFCGSAESWEDWAYYEAEEWIASLACTSDKKVIDELTRYFDYEAFARDLSFDYSYDDVNGTCYIFRNY